MKFRKDINGLRAIAVIAVVLFHFNASWMPGGFAGVDVFFVISGFLMTGIIFKGIEQDSFSILKFYVARVNRIIPALALLCFALLIFGWFYLTQMEYEALGKHVASSLSFVSNFIYWTEIGYFDAVSNEKWLLHTWSLSVEWQFYILYPLILVFIRKLLSIKTIKLMLIMATVLGFIFCVIASYKWPNTSYYLLPARVWEMTIGGVAYLYPFTLQKNKKKLVECIGLALVVGSYFLVSADNPWPGYLALFPVVGAFLIIQAQRNDSIFTGNVVFQKIGSWSYSIYLWHWPIVVVIYKFSLDDTYVYLGIILSLFLGFLSYKYIEKISFPTDMSNLLGCFRIVPVYIALTVGLLGMLMLVKSEAISSLRFGKLEILIAEQQKKDPRLPICGKVEKGISPSCIYGHGPVKAIVIGDSHSQSQNVAIGNRASLSGGSILSLGLSSCSTIKNVYSINKSNQNPDYNCGQLVSNSIDMAAKEYPNIPIIIINRLSSYLYGDNEYENFQLTSPTHFVDKLFTERSDEYRINFANHMISTICEFTKKNPVYLVKPTPEMVQNVPIAMLASLTLSGNTNTVKIPIDEYKKRHNFAFKIQEDAVKICGAKILDPTTYLCDKNYCYGDINGIPLYFDDDHLSSYGSELISPIYDEVFK